MFRLKRENSGAFLGITLTTIKILHFTIRGLFKNVFIANFDYNLSVHTKLNVVNGKNRFH